MVKRAARTLALPAILALGACASRPSVDELASGPIVATKFDTIIDFGSFTTFAVNPTVSLVSDIGDAGTLPAQSGANVVDRITADMETRGYQAVGVSEHPELGMQATVFLNINTATVPSVGAWWLAPGFASAPAFWGDPADSYFVPWSYSTIAYKSGTLVIEAVDLRDAGATNLPDASVVPLIDGGDSGLPAGLEIIWAAYAHAVTQELRSSFGPETQEAIDQAFIQSPYLRRQGTTSP
jgi:hypothetical protein